MARASSRGLCRAALMVSIAVPACALQCSRYSLAHSGCEPHNASQYAQCIGNITLKFSADGKGPPYGLRFGYDSGAREISTSLWTTVDGCALLCYSEPNCAGFVNVGNSSCITVNDTTFAVGTGEVADSYVLRRSPNCTVDCRPGDGLMFGLPADSPPRPVAAGAGLEQCQQYCDVDFQCAGVVVTRDGAGLKVCHLASASAVESPVPTMLQLQSWLKASPAPDREDPRRHSWRWWIADPGTHVFPSAEPAQTAFCTATGGTAYSIDWAAAPGTYAATQVVVKTDPGRPFSTVRVFSDGDLTTARGQTIANSSLEIAAVGLVRVNGSGLNYVNEAGSGFYPDVLLPEPGPETPQYQLAATGKTAGVSNGWRFGFDTGGRTLRTVPVQSLEQCQDQCNLDSVCRGIFIEGEALAASTTKCHLVNDTRLLVPTGMVGFSYRRTRQGIGLPEDFARSVWVGVNVPENAAPGIYQASLSIIVRSPSNDSQEVRTETATVPLMLEVWPIAFACIQEQYQRFGLAFGFDHHAVQTLYPSTSNLTATMDHFAKFTEQRHIPSNSLTGWTPWEDPVADVLQGPSFPGRGARRNQRVESSRSSMTEVSIRRLLRSQHMFPAFELGITSGHPAVADINDSYVNDTIQRIAPRLTQLHLWGLLNYSFVYAFDEAGAEYKPAVRRLFSAIKRRWPVVKTLAVLNWDPTEVVDAVDIWVVLYPWLNQPQLAKAKTVFQERGKEVWGYHCCAPAQSAYLNSFIDVHPMKSRLIPWLAAQQQLSGWLYWYTNWGFRHSDSSTDLATGLGVPLGTLNDTIGSVQYDPRADFRTNEDGNLLYAGEVGPLSSQRLELLRMGFEDRALLSMLPVTQSVAAATRLVRTAANYTFNHTLLEQTRRDVARAIGTRQC